MDDFGSHEADRSKLVDLARGKFPALVAEWDDGDNRMRAFIDVDGCDAELVYTVNDSKLYIHIEEHTTDRLGRDSWRRWDTYGSDAFVRGLIVETLLGRLNVEVRHG